MEYNSNMSIVKYITRESYVEALIWNRKVRDESQLGFEVAIETRIDVARQLVAGQASQWLHETSVLSNQEVVMLVLQMKRIKLELDSC